MDTSSKLECWRSLADEEPTGWSEIAAWDEECRIALRSMASALQGILATEGPHGVGDYTHYAQGYHEALDHIRVEVEHYIRGK